MVWSIEHTILPVPVMLLTLLRRNFQHMKTALTICIIVAATFAWAGENSAPVPPAAAVVKGRVLEVKNVESYTYLRLKTKDGETWAAVSKAPVKQGAEVTLENVMVMTDFKSKSLNKTF